MFLFSISLFYCLSYSFDIDSLKQKDAQCFIEEFLDSFNFLQNIIFEFDLTKFESCGVPENTEQTNNHVKGLIFFNKEMCKLNTQIIHKYGKGLKYLKLYNVTLPVETQIKEITILCPLLKEIKIISCNIKRLDLSDCKNLNKMYVGNSSIPSIETGHEKSHLKIITLKRNYLFRIAEAETKNMHISRIGNHVQANLNMFFSNLELYEITLESNRLAHYNLNFENFKGKKMNISSNSYEKVPNSIFSLLQIETLDLSFNQIPTVDDRFSRLINLQILIFRGNSVITKLKIPSQSLKIINISFCTDLKEIEINNPLNGLNIHLCGKQSVKISGENVEESIIVLELNSILSYPNYNQETGVVLLKDNLCQYKNLEELMITIDSFVYFRNCISNCKNLKKLQICVFMRENIMSDEESRIENGYIKSFVKDLNDSLSIEHLSYRTNEFHLFPSRLTKIKTLKYIYIYFTEIDDSIFPILFLKQLKEIHFTKNIFTYDISYILSRLINVRLVLVRNMKPDKMDYRQITMAIAKNK